MNCKQPWRLHTDQPYKYLVGNNVDGLQVLALGLLRGVQDTTVPMVMATISYWVIGLPVSYVLAFHFDMGGVGLWLGLVIGLAVAAVLLLTRFWGRSVKITPQTVSVQ